MLIINELIEKSKQPETSLVVFLTKNRRLQTNISAKKHTKAEKANLKFGIIVQERLETPCATVPIKFISKFENQNRLPNPLQIKTKGVAIRLITNATVKIGIINKFKKIDKNETPSNVDIKIGKIKNWAESEVARGFAKKFGKTNFLIGFRRKLYTLL